MKGRIKKGTGTTTGPHSQKFVFNSIHELIQAMEREAPTAKGTKASYYSGISSSRDTNWTGGVKGFNDYFDLLKNGYLPAVEELKDTTTGEGQRIIFTPSVYGEFMDVSKYLAGHPECMGTYEEQETENIIRLNLNTWTPAYMEGSELMKKCKAIFSAVNHIENNGKRAEIYISTATTNHKTGQRHDVRIKVKSSEEPLLAPFHGLLIGHLSTTRVLIYAFLSLYSHIDTLPKAEEIEEPDMINISLMNDSPEQIKAKIINQGSKLAA